MSNELRAPPNSPADLQNDQVLLQDINSKIDTLLATVNELKVQQAGSPLKRFLDELEDTLKKEIGDFISGHFHIGGISVETESEFFQNLIDGIWSLTVDKFVS